MKWNLNEKRCSIWVLRSLLVFLSFSSLEHYHFLQQFEPSLVYLDSLFTFWMAVLGMSICKPAENSGDKKGSGWQTLQALKSTRTKRFFVNLKENKPNIM